jgi:hypothetical protein
MTPLIRTLVFSLSVICLNACVAVHTLQTSVPTAPVYTVHPERVLLLNTYDVKEKNYRSNKEELFTLMLDKSLLDLSSDIKRRTGVEPVKRLGLTKTTGSLETRDSLVAALMTEHQASDAIVITSFNVSFDQTDVVVTRNEDGSKDREAQYDIVSNIHYLWFNQDGLYKFDDIAVRRFHSTRSVLSGLFAAGPNVVKQKEDAFAVVEENHIRYLNLFLPGYDIRMRPVFVKKEFNLFKLAVDQQDFEKALLEAAQFINHPDRKIAAQANYNCAVISERLDRHDQVKQYLSESFKLYRYPFTANMLADY